MMMMRRRRRKCNVEVSYKSIHLIEKLILKAWASSASAFIGMNVGENSAGMFSF